MSQQQVELVVRTIAQTAVDNETYFCELDSVVGDLREGRSGRLTIGYFASAGAA